MSGRRDSKARILRSRTVFRGPVFEVRRDEVIEPSGVRTKRDVVMHPGSVVVLPVLRDGRIILVRQFRYAVGGYLWSWSPGARTTAKLPCARRAANLWKRRAIAQGGCASFSRCSPHLAFCA